MYYCIQVTPLGLRKMNRLKEITIWRRPWNSSDWAGKRLIVVLFGFEGCRKGLKVRLVKPSTTNIRCGTEVSL